MARRAWMVPLDLRDPYTAWLIEGYVSCLRHGIGWLTLRSALLDGRPGFWGDNAQAPTSVVYTREGDGELEAFGLFYARPAVRWLVGLGRPVALLTTRRWAKSVRRRAGATDRGEAVSWLPGFYRATPARAAAATRRLTAADAAPFAATAPAWALRCWPSFARLIEDGAAFGVPHGDGFAALAWIVDRTECYDAVGVSTLPRYRDLGLARASATALVEHILRERRRIPLWAASSANAPSQALARALGFTPRVTEAVYRWPPRAPAPREAVESGVGEPRSADDP